MWRVILGTLLVLVLFAGWSLVMFTIGVKAHEAGVKKDGLAGFGGARLVKDGAEIMERLKTPRLDSPDYLSEESSIGVDTWLARYNKWREKK